VTHTFRQNKGVFFKSLTGKDILKQRNIPSMGYESYLLLSEEIFLDRDPFLCDHTGFKRLQNTLPFPVQNKHEKVFVRVKEEVKRLLILKSEE
jgi:hypothetical protein